MSLNFRWLLWSLAILVPVGGAFAGLDWWFGKPATLYSSAERYFAQGEEALQRGDAEAARHAFQCADVQLRGLLAGKDARPTRFLLLRAKVLQGLASLSGGEEMARLALTCAEQAATDPSLAEAQEIMLAHYFRTDHIADAEPYARRFLALPAAERARRPHYYDYESGARYVVAWVALNRRPFRPHDALATLRGADDLARRQPAASNPTARWREAFLEVQALRLRGELARQSGKKTDPAHGPTSTADAEDPRDLLDRLLQRIPDETGPAALAAVTTSPTNLRGLLGLLVLGVDLARTPQLVAERTGLALDVFERLTGDGRPSPLVAHELADHAGQLVAVLDRLPDERRPAPPQRLALSLRLQQLTGPLPESATTGDPATSARLARNAFQAGRADAAAVLAARALRAADERGLPADDPARLEAHAQAARVGLLRNQPAVLEQHLAPLRQSAQLAGLVHLLEGLRAVHEGRLEQAVRHLEEARRGTPAHQRLVPALALARAYLGLGRSEQALVELRQVEAYYEKSQALDGAEQAVAERLVASRSALYLELCRCYLALGQREQASKVRNQLDGKPEAVTASLLLIAYDTNRVRAGSTAALDLARQELERARRLAPDEPAVTWAEAQLILARPEVNRPWLAGTLAGLVTPLPHPGAAPVAMMHIRQALTWHVTQAETLLWEHAAAAGDRPGPRLAWARWLLQRGRYAEAGTVLDELLQAGESPYRLQEEFLRAELHLAQGRDAGDVENLLASLDMSRQQGDAGPLHLASWPGTLNVAQGSGFVDYWRGNLALSRREFVPAARAYARALQLTPLRRTAQTGLLRSVRLLTRQAPRDAAELVAELRRTYPDEPAVLLAFAEVALTRDDIHGPTSMEAALRDLEKALGREDADHAAAGAYLAGRCWLAGGRPDLARDALGRALRRGPEAPVYYPALLQAGQAALAAEDWTACLEYADQLARWEAVPNRQPAPTPGLAREWRSGALEHLGRLEEARREYQRLLDRFPDRPSANLGMVRVLEKAGDPAAALRLLAAWRGRVKPAGDEDRLALRTQVRLLARGPEGPLNEVIARVQAALDDGSLRGKECGLTLAVALGLLDAGRLQRAQEWAAQALARAGDTAAALDARLLLGDIALARCQQETDPARRAEQARAAADVYRSVRTAAPGHALATNNLAWLLDRELGEPAAAWELVQELRRGPTGGKVSGDRLSLDVLDTLGAVCLDSRHFEEAVALFQEAVQRYPAEPAVALHLGRALVGLKRAPEAITQLERAIRLAEERAATAGPEKQAEWAALADQARKERDALGPS